MLPAVWRMCGPRKCPGTNTSCLPLNVREERAGPSLYTLPARGELPTHVPAKSQAQQIPAQRWTHPSPAGGPAHDERAWLGKATSSPSENPEDPAKKCRLRLLQFGANGRSTILFLWIEVLCRWYRT